MTLNSPLSAGPRNLVWQIKFVSDFRCQANRCAKPCCEHYGYIAVEDAMVERYRQEAPDLLGYVTSDGSQHSMIRREGRCSANDGTLCKIQADHGVHLLPQICHFFPRHFVRLGKEIYVSAHLPCDLMIGSALFCQDGFTWQRVELERLPASIKDYQEQFPDQEAREVFRLHQRVMQMADHLGSEEFLLRLLLLAERLDSLRKADWPFMMDGLLKMTGPEKIKTLREKASVPEDDFLHSLVYALLASVKNVTPPELPEILRHVCALVQREGLDGVKRRWREARAATPIDEILKRTLKLRLSENLFPAATWGECLDDVVFLATGYCLLRLAFLARLDRLDSFRDLDQVTRLIMRIEWPFYRARQDLYDEYTSLGLVDLQKMVSMLVYY